MEAFNTFFSMLLQNHGNPTGHKPELVLNNFTTRLGHRVGRLKFLQLLIT